MLQAMVAIVALCVLCPNTLAAHPAPVDTAFKTSTDSKELGEKMQKSWSAFAQAVKNNNLPAVKAMATECIYCNYCLYNTDKENQVFVDSMKKNPDGWTAKITSQLQYLPVDKFMKEDFADIFAAETKAKMADKAAITFHNGNANRKTYNKLCISSRIISSNPNFVEVVINNPSSKPGLNRTFTFIETKAGYKFCGFSIVP